MILFHEGSYYIEHGSRRKGVYNSRVKVSDAGRNDYQKTAVYKAESALDRCGSLKYTHPMIVQFVTCGLIDAVVRQDEFVRLFGSTRMLVEFSSRRKRSCTIMYDGLAKMVFAKSELIYLFDIYHELAHIVTLRSGEPPHGQRFAGAFALIARLSPWGSHGLRTELELMKRNIKTPINLNKFKGE